jgi:hypothetical protein
MSASRRSGPETDGTGAKNAAASSIVIASTSAMLRPA